MLTYLEVLSINTRKKRIQVAFHIIYVAIMTRNPTNWDEYQNGTSHRSSISSAGGRSVHFDEQEGSPSATSGRQDITGERTENDQNSLRRRR